MKSLHTSSKSAKNAFENAPLVRCTKNKPETLLHCSGSAPITVNVRVCTSRNLIMNDMVNRRNIQSSSRNISRKQNRVRCWFKPEAELFQDKRKAIVWNVPIKIL